jgi:hypothetical protein
MSGPAAADVQPSGRKTIRLVAGMGSLHALLFLLSYWLVTSTPGASAADQELLAFYGSGKERRLILVGLYVMPFAGIAFLWFSVALRAWIRSGARRADQLLSDVQLAAGILYVALFFVAAAAGSAMAVSIQFAHSAVDPSLARQLPQYGRTVLIVFAMRMAAMFVFTTSRLGWMTGLLPRWFLFVGLGVGLFLLLSATFSRALVLVFPLWLLVLCALLLAGARRDGARLNGDSERASRRVSG